MNISPLFILYVFRPKKLLFPGSPINQIWLLVIQARQRVLRRLEPKKHCCVYDHVAVNACRPLSVIKTGMAE
jgi:hypothetical protein